MLAGHINPGQLHDRARDHRSAIRSPIRRPRERLAALRHRPCSPATEADYTVIVDDGGTPLDFSDDIVTVIDNVAGRDGVDRLTNIERLQFTDVDAETLVPGLNDDPVGAAHHHDDTPAVGRAD